MRLSQEEIRTLRSRLTAIAERQSADRSVSPGEAAYLAALLDREPMHPDGEVVPDDCKQAST